MSLPDEKSQSAMLSLGKLLLSPRSGFNSFGPKAPILPNTTELENLKYFNKYVYINNVNTNRLNSKTHKSSITQGENLP